MENKQTASASIGTNTAGVRPAIADVKIPARAAMPITMPARPAFVTVASPPPVAAQPAPSQPAQYHAYVPPAPSQVPLAPVAQHRVRNWGIIGAAGVIVLSVAAFVAFRLFATLSQEAPSSGQAVQVPLGQFQSKVAVAAPVVQVNGQLRVAQGVVIDPSLKPNNAVAGQLYFDKLTNQMAYFNGTDFVALLGGSSVNNSTTTINGSPNTVTSQGGTAGHIAKFTGGQAVGDSIMTDDGTTVTVDGNLNLINTTPTADVTLWTPSATPDTPSYTLDPLSVELGTKFQTDVDGIVRGVRFYKGPTNTGSHIGSLWSSNGTLLATATFTSESSTGWQEVRFSNPVAVTAGTTYVVSYHTTVGNYAVSSGYFKANGYDNAPLHALQEGADGPNGVFKYGATTIFPTQDSTGINYWVDVVFSPSASPRHLEINGAQISSTALSNNYDLAKRSTGQVFSGINTFRNATDSSAGFVVQSADTTTLLSADTGAKTIVISRLRVTGNLLVDGHFEATTNDNYKPPTIVAGAAACTSPTVSLAGTDLAGVITVTTGTACASSGTIATTTFFLSYDSAPKVFLTPANAAAASSSGIYVDNSTTTATTFALSLASGNLTNTTTYKWYYEVIQ